MIASVLSSLPLFYLSFFRIPQGVLNKCKSKELGGLGLRDWGIFNKALIDKWRWGLLVDLGCLWGRVLRAKYEIPTHFGDIDMGRKMSSWWKDIIKLCFEDEGARWFNNGLQRVVGDGRGVVFWQDQRVGQEKLREKYSRLH